MINSIEEELFKWNKQKNARDQKSERDAPILSQVQNDVYYWLKIQTKFQAIKQKIKVSTFEAVNDG